MAAQPIFGIVGWKNSGKTTMTAGLVRALTARGLRVSTVKHAHVQFDVDHPGRDSFVHREAGACQVAISSPLRWAVMHELRGEPEPTLDEMVQRMDPCDIILVEGYKWDRHPKLEVRRTGARQTDPLDKKHLNVVAVATDGLTNNDDEGVPSFSLSEHERIASFIVAWFDLQPQQSLPR